MDQSGTPTHKRIARAEGGRDEWRQKAIARREEVEKLKLSGERKSEKIEALLRRQKELERELVESKEMTSSLQAELKKKPLQI